MDFSCNVGTSDGKRGDGDYRISANSEDEARDIVSSLIPNDWIVHSIELVN